MMTPFNSTCNFNRIMYQIGCLCHDVSILLIYHIVCVRHGHHLSSKNIIFIVQVGTFLTISSHDVPKIQTCNIS